MRGNWHHSWAPLLAVLMLTTKYASTFCCIQTAAAMAGGASCLSSWGISFEKVSHLGLWEHEGALSPTESLQEKKKKRESISCLRIQIKTSHRILWPAVTTFTSNKQSQTGKHGWSQRMRISFYCSLICLPFRLMSLRKKVFLLPSNRAFNPLSAHKSILRILSAVKKNSYTWIAFCFTIDCASNHL